MVAIAKLSCCNREMSFGRHVPDSDVTNYPETNCPICGKLVKLLKWRYVEEHLYNIPHVHGYVLPKEEDVLF
jgi:hypothetical protein